MKSTLLAVAFMATLLASPARCANYEAATTVGGLQNILLLLIIALVFVGWFLIGVQFSRKALHRDGAFSILIGFISAAAIPAVPSVVFYHDPGNGDTIGPIWKRIGFLVSMLIPVGYTACATAVFIMRRLKQ